MNQECCGDFDLTSLCEELFIEATDGTTVALDLASIEWPVRVIIAVTHLGRSKFEYQVTAYSVKELKYFLGQAQVMGNIAYLIHPTMPWQRLTVLGFEVQGAQTLKDAVFQANGAQNAT